jgi:hypothetical protein
MFMQRLYMRRTSASAAGSATVTGSAPVENGSRHLRFAGYDPPALCDEEDDHVPRP